MVWDGLSTTRRTVAFRSPDGADYQALQQQIILTEESLETYTYQVGAGNASAIPLSSTSGFLFIPYCAGIPSGVAPKGSLAYNTTNNKLHIYNTSWVAVTLS